MRRLWKYVSIHINDSRKYTIFLAVCALIPAAAGFVLALLFAMAAGIAGMQLVELVFMSAGYPGLGGFLGGVFYLYNQ